MNSTLLKYKSFEIYCKSGLIDMYRESNLPISKVLVTDKIYSDIKKGNEAKVSDLKKIFGTDNYDDCVKVMLDFGEYSMSTEERRKKVDLRKREIISYITKNYTDIKNNNKISVELIEEILKKLKLLLIPTF